MDFIADVIWSPFVCIGWFIVGAVAGALARQLTGSRDAPFLSDLILGLIGAVVGGFIAGLLDISRPEGGLTALLVSLVVATLGAVILITIGRTLFGGGGRTAP